MKLHRVRALCPVGGDLFPAQSTEGQGKRGHIVPTASSDLACPVPGHLVAPHSWLALEERVGTHFEAIGAYFLPIPLSAPGQATGTQARVWLPTNVCITYSRGRSTAWKGPRPVEGPLGSARRKVQSPLVTRRPAELCQKRMTTSGL